jgi:hypothetical protein
MLAPLQLTMWFNEHSDFSTGTFTETRTPSAWPSQTESSLVDAAAGKVQYSDTPCASMISPVADFSAPQPGQMESFPLQRSDSGVPA